MKKILFSVTLCVILIVVATSPAIKCQQSIKLSNPNLIRVKITGSLLSTNDFSIFFKNNAKESFNAFQFLVQINAGWTKDSDIIQSNFIPLNGIEPGATSYPYDFDPWSWGTYDKEFSPIKITIGIQFENEEVNYGRCSFNGFHVNETVIIFTPFYRSLKFL